MDDNYFDYLLCILMAVGIIACFYVYVWINYLLWL